MTLCSRCGAVLVLKPSRIRRPAASTSRRSTQPPVTWPTRAPHADITRGPAGSASTTVNLDGTTGDPRTTSATLYVAGSWSHGEYKRKGDLPTTGTPQAGGDAVGEVDQGAAGRGQTPRRRASGRACRPTRRGGCCGSRGAGGRTGRGRWRGCRRHVGPNENRPTRATQGRKVETSRSARSGDN
jgi:hypothetical protein